MLPVAAYADRLSIRPGETIRFHAANATQENVSARIVRVINADANPNGPGIVTEEIQTIDAVLEPTRQAVPHGSYGVVTNPQTLGETFTVIARIKPGLLGQTQTLISQTDVMGSRGWALALNDAGSLTLLLGDGNALQMALTIDQPLSVNHWSQVWMCRDGNQMSIGIHGYRRGALTGQPTVASGTLPAFVPASDSPLLIAAQNHQTPIQHFNGRIDAPALFSRALTDAERSQIAISHPSGLTDALAAWDFAQNTSSDVITDRSPNGAHGHVVNTPVRAVAGATWTAQVMAFAQAPEQYGAIHFHDDDITDCLWPVCYEWTPPAGTRSAVYALMLQAGEHQDNVPFHLVAAKGKPTAKIAVLASTFTYTVYGNNARPEWTTVPEWPGLWHEQSAAWGAYPHNPGDHVEYGLSTYNNHPDGSGISIASWHRPMLNVRIGYISFQGEAIRASGLRHFPADMHLVSWLEHNGYEYDIVSDVELHNDGIDAISGYQVVLTGAHPEYHTTQTLDALEQFRDQGGRFCYLGGNGFYWKVALNPIQEGVIEIRRGEGGIRAWAAEPGEYYNQFDGEYGGLWRRNGRPPQDLAGVGFTAQGNFSGSYYRIQPEARESRAGWIFNGVDTETFGDHGLSAHGAAGFELDRADKNLGTPSHAVVVASSENHPPDAPWILVPEEMLTHLLTWPHQPATELIRADMTFFETPNGGAVFSTGSITFCGSLVTNNYENDVSKILGNVVDRFLDPSPFSET